MIRRLSYLTYYLYKLNWLQLRQFQAFVKQKVGVAITQQWVNSIIHVLRYNISITEYYQFGFWKRGAQDKESWAGTGFMYEYQLRMNPLQHRDVLDDKIMFMKHYACFIKRKHATIGQLIESGEAALRYLMNDSSKLVLKWSKGQVGAEVRIIGTDKLDFVKLIQIMREGNYDLVEEFIVQHSILQKLSPSAVNTVRVITQVTDNNVQLLGCRLRIAVNSDVDNLGAGNLAAPVDCQTGVVTGAAVYSDITKPSVSRHPITHFQIIDLQLPFWSETIELVRMAALYNTNNRSIGWDVAITPTGPELIEGNHNWCKLLWQMPVDKGLKSLLTDDGR